MFVASIPLVGIIMMFVWAFGNDGNQTRSNRAKGALIYAAILLIIYFLFFMIFGAALFALGSTGPDYGY